MQRYRVNYTALFITLSCLVVGSAALYGLWRFQVNRNAGSLVERARTKAADKDYQGAAELYHRYLLIRPEDKAIMIARAKARQEFIDNEETSPKIKHLFDTSELNRELIKTAFTGALEYILRVTPNAATTKLWRY